MYFSIINKVRIALIATVIIGIFAWNASWMPAAITAFLVYLIPVLAALNILHEIGVTAYLHIAFDSIKADVVELDDTSGDKKLPEKNYHVTFLFNGAPYTTQFAEAGIINSLEDGAHCYVRVQRESPHAVFIDGFKLKYMNLCYAIVLAIMVYSYSGYGG